MRAVITGSSQTDIQGQYYAGLRGRTSRGPGLNDEGAPLTSVSYKNY